MKTRLVLLGVTFVSLISVNVVKVSAQVIPTYYDTGALSYGYNDNDDVGILLAILLLAARNQGCGCCNNCCGYNGNGSNGQTVIPYPIPIPISNSYILRNGDNGATDDGSKKTKQVVNVYTKNETEAESEADSTSNVKSSSSSSSNSKSGNR